MPESLPARPVSLLARPVGLLACPVSLLACPVSFHAWRGRLFARFGALHAGRAEHLDHAAHRMAERLRPASGRSWPRGFASTSAKIAHGRPSVTRRDRSSPELTP